MNKKNLIILLLIPFIISLLSIVTINLTFNLIENDLIGIKWDYQDNEAFKVSSSMYELKAEGIAQNKYPPSIGNELVWTVVNKNLDEEDHAEIVYKNGKYYLHTVSKGDVIITCSNAKGTVFKQMVGIIYDNSAIIANPINKSSQNNIDSTLYYGEYDLVNNKKELAKTYYTIKTAPSELISDVEVKSISDNIEFTLGTGQIRILKEGHAKIELGFTDSSNSFVIEFEVVDNGVNVYSYDDLLACTNKSEQGEIVVLRKSFESLENTYEMNNGEVVLKNNEPVLKQDNVELFGHYNPVTKKYSFDNEIYKKETKFNRSYIDQWNEFVSKNPKYKKLDSKINVGIYLQKDFYGNGYTLNLHNLTYPYSEMIVSDGNQTYSVPYLTNDNLFRGPLPFYTLGDPNDTPLITAYGQDNVGVYVEGEGIVINDANIKNCDFGNSLSNLEYVGTTLELDGDNIKVINSRLANGKNVVRAYSTNNLTISNCLISSSRNFLLQVGCNEYVSIDEDKVNSFTLLDGTKVSLSNKEYFAKKSYADEILTKFISETFTTEEEKQAMKNALVSMQNATNNYSVEGLYKGSINIEDTLFYQSGISSICLDTLFNGPYLYSNIPSLIGELFSELSLSENPLVPLEANGICNVSYPVQVNLIGSTRFYDYKKNSSLDLQGLIGENITTIANSILENSIRKITIDDIFPIKNMLISKALEKGCILNKTVDEENVSYFNIPISYYGGGLNLSSVNLDALDNKDKLSNKLEINLLNNYLNLQESSSMMGTMKNLMLKTVTITTGIEPFNFICMDNSGYLFGETPNVSSLKSNVKGV